jgi:uncharacterized metal-binding protein
MATKEECLCGEAPVMIYPCSGSADVGEIADRAARVLDREGVGKMSCLAGIGGGVSGLIESARGASRVLAIDGCPIDCAKKTLQKAGITEFIHVRVTDHGMKKGQSAVTDETVGRIAGAGETLLAGR